eukprot:symbB.v1.2.014400.t1/scaffold1053.1/size141410/7
MNATAMEAANVRRAHTAAVQAQRQQRLEDFQKSCKKRASANARKCTSETMASQVRFRMEYVDETMKSWVVGPSPVAPSFDRLAAAAVSARREALQRLAGDAQSGRSEAVVGCMESAHLPKESAESEPGSTTMHAQHSPSSAATPSKASVTGFTGFSRLLKAHS